MDNITHSLVGVALAEVAGLSLQDREAADRWRPTLWAVSVAANNLPDLDVLWSHALGGKLGYLLHHRGHTHTLVAALGQALLLLAVVVLVQRWRERPLPLPGRLAALCLAGPFVHLGMDAWNVYGVHPFWPSDPRWFYGDRVFVLEPWIWALLMPPAALAPGVGRRARLALAATFLGVVGVAAIMGKVPGEVVAGLLLAAGVSVAAARRSPTRASAAGLALVLMGLAGLSGLRHRAEAAVRAASPAPLHDVVLTPFPADPRCWAVLTVEGDPGVDLYRLRRGAWAAGAGAAACLARDASATTAPLLPADLPDTGSLAWKGRFDASLAELRRLDREHCRFSAFLRFARAPFWLRRDGAWVYGDLRFDRGAALGFAELRDRIGAADACEDLWVPSWGKPVAPLLRSSR